MACNTQTQAGRFMFVEYSKPVVPVKGQKRLRGGPSDVRAHITKNYHRALRVKRLESLKKSDVPPSLRHQDSSGSYEDDEVEELGYADADISNTARPSPPSLSWTESTSSDTSATSYLSDTHSNPYQNTTLQNHHHHHPSHPLSTILGQGRLDPFDVLPISTSPFLSTSTSPNFIHLVLDHALVHSWPKTVPFRPSTSFSPTTINPVNSSWLKLAMDHPVALHAFLYATSFHILCAYAGREISREAALLRLSHKVEAIRLVNEELRGLSLGSSGAKESRGGRRASGASAQGRGYGDDGESEGEAVRGEGLGLANKLPTDALIMAVTILGIHSHRDETIYPKVHPLSPLAKLNNLDIYGAMINDEKHFRGMMLLINQRGGLHAIQIYGMADTLQLCDVYFSSKFVSRPNFAWRHPVTSLVADGRHILDPAAIDLDSKLGAGFRYLRHTFVGQQLLDVLDAFSEITVALDHYVRGGPTAPGLVDLMEARNCAQHRLLSQLPNPLELSDPELCIHHAIRLATLIFSEMVVFPLPPPQGVKPRLALMLRKTLEACRFLDCWELHTQVLLWALTLGAVASSYTAQRSWYIGQLLQQTSLMQIEDSFVLESICSRFLWWKPICSEPLQWVWDEIVAPTELDLT